MANELSTLGIKFGYAAETTADTKPTAFTQILGCKSLPELNSEPSQIDVTPLEETGFKRYIPGLQDIGGAFGIGFNLSADLVDAWGDVCDAAETAKAANKSMWYEIFIPNMTNGFYFTGEPTKLAWGGAEVDAGLETTCYITVNQIKGWDTAIEPDDPNESSGGGSGVGG